jgi:hypothetical protein
MATRLIAGMLLLLVILPVSAQVTEDGERQGLLQGTASLYPARMLNHSMMNNYVGGHLNYYVDDHYSFRGDVFVYIDAQGDQKYLNRQIQLQAGFMRHFPVKRWDPFVGLQAGLSALELQSSPDHFLQPVLGLTTGVSFMVSGYFYFYAECSYQHMNDPVVRSPLDQLFVTGGLGFQLSTRRGS